jgi:hypothetical protein
VRCPHAPPEPAWWSPWRAGFPPPRGIRRGWEARPGVAVRPQASAPRVPARYRWSPKGLRRFLREAAPGPLRSHFPRRRARHPWGPPPVRIGPLAVRQSEVRRSAGPKWARARTRTASGRAPWVGAWARAGVRGLSRT